MKILLLWMRSTSAIFILTFEKWTRYGWLFLAKNCSTNFHKILLVSETLYDFSIVWLFHVRSFCKEFIACSAAFQDDFIYFCIAVGANLCTWRPLEIVPLGEGVRWEGGVIDKEATNILPIPQTSFLSSSSTCKSLFHFVVYKVLVRPCHGSGGHACLLPRSPGFAPWSVHVGFVVDKVALRQVFLLVLRFSSVNIIQPLLSTLMYH
jgi:hypothetical protein